MSVLYPAMVPTAAEIHLDVLDSSGGPVRTVMPKIWRPLAISHLQDLAYGFVINDSTIESILPGETVTCTVSFINHEDAQHVFPRGEPILFGDGVVTRGVLKLL